MQEAAGVHDNRHLVQVVRGSEEEEMDRMYEDWVTSNHLANIYEVPSLQALIVTVISEKFIYARQKGEPHGLLLDYLPGPILYLIQESLPEHLAEDYEVIKQLITPRTQHLVLKFNNNRHWTPQQVINLVEVLMSEGIKDKLKTLAINLSKDCVCPISEHQLQDIILQQSKVVELQLSGCGIGDCTINIIALTCKDISILNVSENRKVTDVGLSHLVGCVNLTSLNIINTSFSPASVTKLLRNLRQLEEFSLTQMSYYGFPAVFGNNFCIDGDAMLELLKKYKNLFLPKLNCLNVTDKRENNIANHIGEIFSMLPNLRKVSLHGSFNILDLCKINKLEELYLDIPNINSLVDVTTKFSLTLTSIIIFVSERRSPMMDLSVFCTCVNLERLDLEEFHFAPEPKHKLLPSSFGKLADLSLTGPDDQHVNVIPDEIAFKMLTSPYLEHCHISYVNVKEDVLNSVLSEAKSNNQILANIRQFSIELLDELYYSLETVIKLVCVLPNSTCHVSNFVLELGDLVKFEAFASRHGIKLW